MGFNKVGTIYSTQTIYDLALQYYGSVDKVITMIGENPNLVNLETLPSGEIKYTLNNDEVQKFFFGKSISTRPEIYYNTINLDYLITDQMDFLVQENSYKIIL